MSHCFVWCVTRRKLQTPGNAEEHTAVCGAGLMYVRRYTDASYGLRYALVRSFFLWQVSLGTIVAFCSVHMNWWTYVSLAVCLCRSRLGTCMRVCRIGLG